MKTLFATNNLFEAFETLSAQELNEIKGGYGRDADVLVDPDKR